MIPSDVRLFTWLDVEEVVARAATDAPPHWLVRASAYWNELTVSVKNNNSDDARQWIREVFDPRITNLRDADTLGIVLEAVNGDVRVLPVVVEEIDDVPSGRPLPPTFHRPSAVEQGRTLARPQLPLAAPPIAAFHSFKGGVGRTTQAVSLAAAASERYSVLLIDADVEAPGISWLIRSRLPSPPVAFADLIALAHGDTSPGCQKTVKLVVDRLRNAPLMGAGSPPSTWCYVLPSFRNLGRLPFLEIRPENLLTGQDNPFVLTEVISAVGRELGVSLVVVDLRAGYSELAAGLLLDPRVYRTFVTTLSGQSLEGTLELLKVLGARAPSQEEYEPYPAIVVSHIPEGFHREDWKRDFDRLVEARACFLPAGADPTDDPLILESPFDQGLQMMAADWEDATRVIRRSAALSASTKAILEWLPVDASQRPNDASTNGLGSITDRRGKLEKSANDRIFAEKRVGDDFLDTSPLRALAGDNISQLPIAVVVGAKGAGKTFTFLQQVRIGTWGRFVDAVIRRSPEIDAPLSPVLFSKNLGEDALRLVTDAGMRVSRGLAFENPMPASDIRDTILGHLTTDQSEAAWRELWLDCIAWANGFRPQVTGAGRQFAERLDQNGQRLIALFDGLEDLFQDITTSSSQQTALRALLQDVPLWLAQRPARNLAILVYVRRDLVSLAVRQNYAQLLDRYGPYRLQWDRVEALRLTNWLWSNAIGAPADRSDLEEEALKEHLFPLWGRKLGTDESREARTADWVLNALSDYNDQIQARDLVRFISVAARKSTSDSKWEDRYLTPPAIRDALPDCSREKIIEIKRENEALKKVFEKIEYVPQSQRLLPFEASFAMLDAEDLRILEENGAIFNDLGSYYLPEIYLHGLGFSYSKPGRRRVLSNRRK
jgi:CobQ/CobB/MinD/ParA nucleotide binding domain